VARQHIGQLLDALGVTADIADDDMVTDALVVLKVVKADGAVSLNKVTSEALDWVTGLGMLTAAQGIENSGYEYADTDTDEQE
jgi:hypothetical protein